MRARQWPVLTTLAALVLLLVSAAAQEQGQVREFTISGSHYAFSPSSIAVNKDDLIKITFTAQDMPHSFTIDGYRIVKRAGAGRLSLHHRRRRSAAAAEPPRLQRHS